MLKTFPQNCVKPTGWMKRQLEIQAKGLSGNLDKIWPDIRDSAWIGGDREGWERVPYWLDGFIPLAYLLDDADLKERAHKYLDAIVERQQPDGWICPCEEEKRVKYDIWSAFLIGKVFSTYCELTGDAKVEEALYRSMKCLYDLLESKTIALFQWGKFRWFEALIPLLYLYERRKEDWMMKMAELLKEQGADYPSFTETWKRPLNVWTLHTHIVNIAMMFKYEALYCHFTGKPHPHTEEKLWDLLREYNGTAVGTLTGDECLSGVGPTHGTELCSVVELMYSFELLYAITGKSIWAERLEEIAFNALPATLSDDMWTHQYDQISNQTACFRIPGPKKFYRTNGNDSNVFGLEPHFGCCTSNFSQGWPKLCMNAYLRSDKGVVCPVILPAQLHTQIKGADVSIACQTDYPFRFEASYTVKVSKPVKFALKIRLPRWAKAVYLNGERLTKRDHLTLDKTFTGEERFELRFEDTPRLVSRPKGLKVARYGALHFSIPLKITKSNMLEYVDKDVERKFPYCDYEWFTEEEWRYGFASKELTAQEQKGDEIPFSSQAPSLTLKAQVAPISWDYADGYEHLPESYPNSNRALGPQKEITLVPYGCSKLRMTEIPLTKKGK